MKNNLLSVAMLLSMAAALSAWANNIPVETICGPACPPMCVNTLNGNMFYERPDLFIPGQGLSLDFTFAYNSHRTARNFGYGNGWTFTYNMLYELVGGGPDIAVRRSDGRRDVYTWNGTDYDPPVGIFDILDEYAPGQFSLTRKSGIVYFFDDNTHRRLTSIVEPNGNTIAIGYSGGLPTTVTDATGRSVNLTFTGGLLTQIDDPNFTPARSISYTYDANDNMIEVTNALGNSINYVYDVNRNMIRIEDANNNIFTAAYSGTEVTQLASAISQIDFSYVGLQTVLEEQIPGGGITMITYTYDAQDRLISAIGELPGGDVQYAYDADNNITQITDADGNVSAFTFDTRGNTLTATDALGFQEQWTYDPTFNNVTSHLDKMGNLTQFTHDANGNLLQIDRPLGVTENFTYFANGNLRTSTDGNGNTTSYGYNANGYRTTVTGPLTNQSFGYDDVGNLISETDGNGNTNTHAYNALNRMTSHTDALGNTTLMGYDPNKNPTSWTDPDGNVTTRTYDALDRVIEISFPGGANTQYTYENHDKVTSSIDANGNITLFDIDDSGNLMEIINAVGDVKSFVLDNLGNVVQMTDEGGGITNYAYDALGQATSITDPTGEVTSYTYDAAGNVATVTLPNGNVRSFTYDALGRLIDVSDLLGPIETNAYDNNSNLTGRTDANGNTTLYTFNAENMLTAITDPAGNASTFGYDGAGNRISVIDRNSNTTAFSYDAENQRVSDTDPDGNVTTYIYDNRGNLSSITDARGNTTSFRYDNRNRLTREIYPDATTRIFTHDNNGNITSRTDNNGDVTSYTYDQLNRLTLRDYPGFNDDNFGYDAVGRITSASNAAANLTFNFDLAGRLLAESLNGQTTSYSYAVGAGELNMTYPSGRNITKSNDLRGRLSDILDGGVNIVNYAYDPADRLITRSYPATGNSSDYSYNTNNWVTSVVFNPGAFGQFNYTLNNEGSRLFEEKVHHPTNSRGFSYDDNYQLVRDQEGTFAGGIINPVISQEEFLYDPVGNRRSTDFNGLLTTYTTNNLNQYTSITRGGTVNPGHDDNGNLVFDGVNAYGYDFANRLTDINGGGTASYAYDPFGRRIQKQAAGIVTNYLYSGRRVIEERDGGGVTLATYVYGNGVDEVLSMDRGGGTFYYFHDALGSVAVVTDGGGTVEERYEYRGFGETLVFDPAFNPLPATAIGNPYTFTGRRFDEESGLYYYRARSYDPDHGRFMQRDPAGFTDGVNLYAYVKNNPINFADPSGLIGVFVSGLSGSSGGGISESTGMQDMATTTNPQIPGGSQEFNWWQPNAATQAICKALCKNPNQPVILVGHSLGGASVMSIARKLDKKCIKVDLLVQLESVGFNDEVLPGNVETGVNYYAGNPGLVQGAQNVQGSHNEPVPGATHTTIDNADNNGHLLTLGRITQEVGGGNFANKNWRKNKKKKETTTESAAH